MAVKKVYKSQKKSAAVSSAKKHVAPSYRDLIVTALKDLTTPSNKRSGINRAQLKSSIKENNPALNDSVQFERYFKTALNKGVADGVFLQPKGPAGNIKLAKPAAPAPAPAPAPVPAKKPVPTATTTSKKTITTTTPKKVVKKTTPPAPKKVVKKTTPPANKKIAATSYKTMIIRGVDTLNGGKGSSRIALKKYLKEQIAINKSTSGANFDYLVNKTIKKAVEDGYLSQPKGPSGLVKILKKGKAFAKA